jgi:hypothetical protein
MVTDDFEDLITQTRSNAAELRKNLARLDAFFDVLQVAVRQLRNEVPPERPEAGDDGQR